MHVKKGTTVSPGNNESSDKVSIVISVCYKKQIQEKTFDFAFQFNISILYTNLKINKIDLSL